MLCSWCAKQFAVERATSKMVPRESMIFCSDKCLYTHVSSQVPLPAEDLVGLGIGPAIMDSLPRECYSPLLGVSFRSWFECLFAEHAVKVWKEQVFYEPHMLRLDGTHYYIPDFWLPRFGVWLEVKGEWRLGAKKKFVDAQRVLGADRLLLVPPLYRRWFSGKRRW